jgi:hypothetical protein
LKGGENMKTNIPLPTFLAEMSEEGTRSFEQQVLEGSLLKRFIRSIEDSALEGYTGYRHKIHPGEDIRSLKVIQKVLKEAGYKCEFENIEKKGLITNYFENYLVIKWSK